MSPVARQFSTKAQVTSGCRKRGIEFRGGSLHDGFGGFVGFGGSGEHLDLLLLVLQNTEQRGSGDGFDYLAVSVMAVSVMAATPLNSTTLFQYPESMHPHRSQHPACLHACSADESFMLQSCTMRTEIMTTLVPGDIQLQSKLLYNQFEANSVRYKLHSWVTNSKTAM